MKVGMCLPYMKAGLTRADFLAWMRRIDQGPFHALSCGERVTGPTCDMRILLAAAGAVTERVRIHATLYVLPMHNAVRVAKEIATLDVLCDGRLDITVGVGGREKDYQAVGASFKGRFARLDAQVAEMRDIWAGSAPFAGADPVGPAPHQVGGPRLLAGVMGPKSMARVSRWADGVYAFSMNGERQDIHNILSMAGSAWQASGRDCQPYCLGGFWCSLAPNGPERLRQYVYDYLRIAGDEVAALIADGMTRHNRNAVREALDNMEAAGCEEVFVVPATADLAEIDELEAVLASR